MNCEPVNRPQDDSNAQESQGAGVSENEKRMTGNPGNPRRRGGQPGNRNALKHGRTTKAAKSLRKEMRERIRAARTALRDSCNASWPQHANAPNVAMS
jgi:hypothetical protein